VVAPSRAPFLWDEASGWRRIGGFVPPLRIQRLASYLCDSLRQKQQRRPVVVPLPQWTTRATSAARAMTPLERAAGRTAASHGVTVTAACVAIR
jgi:hypothetical protein